MIRLSLIAVALVLSACKSTDSYTPYDYTGHIADPAADRRARDRGSLPLEDDSWSALQRKILSIVDSHVNQGSRRPGQRYYIQKKENQYVVTIIYINIRKPDGTLLLAPTGSFTNIYLNENLEILRVVGGA